MEGAPVMDHDDAGPRVLISIWLLTGMATVFLAVRIWCKFLTRRLLWWDDYILILSWVSELLWYLPGPSALYIDLSAGRARCLCCHRAHKRLTRSGEAYIRCPGGKSRLPRHPGQYYWDVFHTRSCLE